MIQRDIGAAVWAVALLAMAGALLSACGTSAMAGDDDCTPSPLYIYEGHGDRLACITVDTYPDSYPWADNCAQPELMEHCQAVNEGNVAEVQYFRAEGRNGVPELCVCPIDEETGRARCDDEVTVKCASEMCQNI